jgi:hypothetical protein
MKESTDEQKNHVKMKCFSKTPECKSKSCETTIECPESELKTHCYSIMNPVQTSVVDTDFDNNTNINILDGREDKSFRMEVHQAGCYNGGEDCQPLSDLAVTMKERYAKFGINTTYKIPNILLEMELQNRCIGK